ncbi:MAG: hypothetical protein N2746_03525 [Deltaproteobacteria bacterium]|nr:hypothetical protein [Deltaproteobacteria bacterium]
MRYKILLIFSVVILLIVLVWVYFYVKSDKREDVLFIKKEVGVVEEIVGMSELDERFIDKETLSIKEGRDD